MKKGFIESKEYMFQEEAEERVDNRNVSGYRVKTITAGRQRECEIYPIFSRRSFVRGKNYAPTKESVEKYNKKQAQKRLIRLLNANFTAADVWGTFTYFKNMKVTEIGAADILKFQAHLNSLNLSTSYKSSIRSVLNHFFSYLKIHNIQNPVKLVKGFKKNREQKREIQFWTEQEFKIFIKSVDDKRFYAVFSFLYLTGCRKGEALALQWKDVDLENKNVKIKTTISKATDKTRTVNDGIKLDSQYRITTPKTENSYRTILLPLNLVGILKNLKENASETDFVFGNENKIMSFNTLQNAFKRYIKRSGVKDIRIHDLRHSHVSLLINKGSNQLATLYIIAARLGDTVDMILKTYGHLFPNNQTEIICKLNIDF